MTTPRPLPDTVLVAYGLLTGGGRLFLPPVWDIPFLRTVRGAMYDRQARAASVTITAEARRILVDLEEPTTGRGAVEQVARWAAGRFIPGAAAVDAARNALRTYAAGAIFERYLTRHRAEPRDPVLDGFEAERVRRALREAIDVLSVEHVRAITRLATESFDHARTSKEISIVQRYSDALVTAVAELPNSWVDVIDGSFVRALANPTR